MRNRKLVTACIFCSPLPFGGVRRKGGRRNKGRGRMRKGRLRATNEGPTRTAIMQLLTSPVHPLFCFEWPRSNAEFKELMPLTHQTHISLKDLRKWMATMASSTKME